MLNLEPNQREVLSRYGTQLLGKDAYVPTPSFLWQEITEMIHQRFVGMGVLRLPTANHKPTVYAYVFVRGQQTRIMVWDAFNDRLRPDEQEALLADFGRYAAEREQASAVQERLPEARRYAGIVALPLAVAGVLVTKTHMGDPYLWLGLAGILAAGAFAFFAPKPFTRFLVRNWYWPKLELTAGIDDLCKRGDPGLTSTAILPSR